MVSFIVIARDEEFIIKKCINSIIQVSQYIDNHEIIFIDSSSTDKTLEIVRRIRSNKIRVFQLESPLNAASARNIGIRYAKYNFIFFIDGDVEIDKSFVLEAIKELDADNIGIVTGQLAEQQYSLDFQEKLEFIKDRQGISKKGFRLLPDGGIFITKKEVLNDIGGFDEILKINEDIDFILRVMSKYKILGVPLKMGIHHTIPYQNHRRIIDFLLSIDYFFPGVLFRKNIFSFNRIIKLIMSNYGIYLGLFFWIILIISLVFDLYVIKVSLAFFVVLDIFWGIRKGFNKIIGRGITRYVFSFYFVIGLLFFPVKKENKYHEIID